MILNYHHRLANTHSMPKWISIIFLQVTFIFVTLSIQSRWRSVTFDSSRHIYSNKLVRNTMTFKWYSGSKRGATHNHSLSDPSSSVVLSLISVVAVDPKNVATWTAAHQEIHPAAGNFITIDLQWSIDLYLYWIFPDKNGKAGGRRQEFQFSAGKRSRHGRRLSPCWRIEVLELRQYSSILVDK